MRKLLAALLCVAAFPAAAQGIWRDPGFIASTGTFTGQIKAPDGTAAAPAYTFGSKTDLGLYYTANTLNFSIGSANGLSLSASGAVFAVDVSVASAGLYSFASRGSIAATADGLFRFGNAGLTASTKIRAAIPTMGACGTSPSVTGTDSGAIITVGTGGVATTCTMNFSGAWSTAPTCVVQNNTDRVAYSVAPTTTVVVITATAAFTASSKFNVICLGL